MAESDYVFVQQNQLPERFAALRAGEVFTVAETGFGTGLNFLQTLRAWFECAPKSAELQFISFEKFPLSVEDLAKAHGAFAELGTLSQALCAVYPLRLPGWHEMSLFDGKVRLIVWFGDLLLGLPEFECSVDAWFLDGFAPSKNPDMWQPALYTQMARLSHVQTTFATFTAVGEVRRGLQKAGFAVEKMPGFGRKREMCRGNCRKSVLSHRRRPGLRRRIRSNQSSSALWSLAPGWPAQRWHANWRSRAGRSECWRRGRNRGNRHPAIWPARFTRW